MKRGCPEQYCEKFVETLLFFIDDPRSLATRNVLSNVKIAKLLKVSPETVKRWRTIGSGYYKKPFAEAIEKLQEVIYSGEIKMGLIDKARGYTEHKYTRELQTKGVTLPALSKMSVKQLLEYARHKLKLRLKKTMARYEIELAIREAAETAETSEMVIVKHESKNIAADVAAAERVLSNIGTPEKRWQFKQQTEMTVSFSDFMKKAKEIANAAKQ